MGKRLNLKGFRVQKGLDQSEMAKIMNVGLTTYVAIENGTVDGKLMYWELLKNYFNLTGAEIWNLIEKQPTQES